MKYREAIVDGLENALRAFNGRFQGENLGKISQAVWPASSTGIMKFAAPANRTFWQRSR